MQRHQRDQALPPRASRPGRSRARSPGGSSERVGSAAVRLVLARDADELLEVLDPAAAPRSSARPRAPRCSRCARARARRARPPASSSAPAMQRLQQRAERLHRRERRRAEAGLLGAVERLPERDALRVGERLQPRERRVADPAARPVRDPRERDGVVRVVDHLQVRDRVLDLGALVEARPADHLVGDALADEHVLEHARLRVRPVEDRDLAAGVALLDERRRSRRRRSAPRRARPRPRARAPARPRRARTRGSSPCARGCARSPRSRRCRIAFVER